MTITPKYRLYAVSQCLSIISSTEWPDNFTARRLIRNAHRITIAAKSELDEPGGHLTPDRALSLLGVLDAMSYQWAESEGLEMVLRAKSEAETLVFLALKAADSKDKENDDDRTV